jgi:hypothetical protein
MRGQKNRVFVVHEVDCGIETGDAVDGQRVVASELVELTVPSEEDGLSRLQDQQNQV